MDIKLQQFKFNFNKTHKISSNLWAIIIYKTQESKTKTSYKNVNYYLICSGLQATTKQTLLWCWAIYLCICAGIIRRTA